MHERLATGRLGVNQGSKRVDCCDVCTHFATITRPHITSVVKDLFESLGVHERDLKTQLEGWWEAAFVEDIHQLRRLHRELEEFVERKPETPFCDDWALYKDIGGLKKFVQAWKQEFVR